MNKDIEDSIDAIKKARNDMVEEALENGFTLIQARWLAKVTGDLIRAIAENFKAIKHE